MALGPLLALAAGRLQSAELRDRPLIPDEAMRGPEGGLVAMVDALRFVGFAARPGEGPGLAADVGVAVQGLPAATRPEGEAVADALGDAGRLTPALLALARSVEREGRLAAGAALYVNLYELALLRCDGPTGLDAAHGAARTFRKLTEWREALRWYQLGLRLAIYDDDFLQATRLLDGLGNTHRERGAFPAARRCYRDAARMAVVAGDPVEAANVALGLMTVEREAGRLDAAARIAWQALARQTDPRQRTNLLLNLGTLLRDGGALDAAEDTYRLVGCVAEDAEVRLMARDALAYCAALRGTVAEYEERRTMTRALARAASPYIRAQIAYFRGASLRALGDARAVRVLHATERYARAHGLREWEVRAGALAEAPMPQAVATVRAPEEVQRGIRELLANATRGDRAVG
jgi:tetratricopeptide (TPR) repeat protein